MKLSIFDCLRMVLARVDGDKATPFPFEVPNALTRETLHKSERGKDVYRAKDADDLFRQLNC